MDLQLIVVSSTMPTLVKMYSYLLTLLDIQLRPLQINTKNILEDIYSETYFPQTSDHQR